MSAKVKAAYLQEKRKDLKAEAKIVIENLESGGEIYSRASKIVKGQMEIIDEYANVVDELQIQVVTLENEIFTLKNRVSILETQVAISNAIQNKQEAIEKLHECDALANNKFQQLYREEFKLDDYAYVPSIGNFIRTPPSNARSPQQYKFWQEFISKYPGSDNPQFNTIYRQINNNRAPQSHPDISEMTREEFIKAIKIVFPEEYKRDSQLYDEYKEWLFSFPA
jgi:hypothetical protein